MLSKPLEVFNAEWLAKQPVIQEMAARINVPVEEFAQAAAPKWPTAPSPAEVHRDEG